MGFLVGMDAPAPSKKRALIEQALDLYNQILDFLSRKKGEKPLQEFTCSRAMRAAPRAAVMWGSGGTMMGKPLMASRAFTSP